MTKGIVLIADNIEQFANVRAEILRRAGYKVLPACSFEQAEEMLRTQWIHLAILDIRLIDDLSEDDESGLVLARDPRFSGITKMILTGFPTLDNIRSALTPDTQRNSRIVRFLSKKEGAEKMVENVEQIFQEFIHISRTLQIRWKNPSQVSLAHIAMLLRDGVSVFGLEDQIGELDDLLRMMFLPYEQLTISRILWCRGHQMALDASLYSGENTTPAILLISQRSGESNPRSDPDIMPIQHLLQPTHSFKSLNFKASAWRLEHSIEDAVSLGEFIQSNTDKRAISILESLYRESLSLWYSANLRLSEESNLSHYKILHQVDGQSFSATAIHQKVTHLLNSAVTSKLIHGYDYTEQIVSLQLVSGRTIVFDNPLLLPETTTTRGNTRLVQSPGSLSLDNILVDRSGMITLTSLDEQQLVPYEYDFVSLEMDVHEFSAAHSGSLVSIHEFEKGIASANNLDTSFVLSNIDPELRKSILFVQTIRRLANESFSISLATYLSGIWFLSLYRLVGMADTVKLSHKEIMSYIQCLMLCGLTAGSLRRLDPGVPLQRVMSGIVIDDNNHQVYLNEQPVSLTPTEYDLLHYLYERSGNLCRRSEIMRDVFNYGGADNDSEKSLLNTHVGRLKAKIESDPTNPRYITTVRGQGYRLLRNPEE